MKQIGLLGLAQAFEARYKDNHEMAEYLNVTEEFLADTLTFYKNKYDISIKQLIT